MQAPQCGEMDEDQRQRYCRDGGWWASNVGARQITTEAAVASACTCGGTWDSRRIGREHQDIDNQGPLHLQAFHHCVLVEVLIVPDDAVAYLLRVTSETFPGLKREGRADGVRCLRSPDDAVRLLSKQPSIA